MSEALKNTIVQRNCLGCKELNMDRHQNTKLHINFIHFSTTKKSAIYILNFGKGI